MTVQEIIGTSGATILLIAFIMNQLNKWKNDSIIYDGFNVIGGALMTAYAFILQAWPFFILNSVWTIVSIKDCIIFFSKKNK